MKKRYLQLLILVFILIILTCTVHGSVKKFILPQSKFQPSINTIKPESLAKYTQEKIIKVFDDNGDLLAINPKNLSALRGESETFDVDISPTQATVIQSVRLEGLIPANLDRDLVTLSDVPHKNSEFTKFDVLSSSNPLVDMEKIILDYGYICAGPRYQIYKCTDWDNQKGLCRNDTTWTPIKVVKKGLHRVILTMTPEDPGIGIGPDPYGSVCGDNFCEGNDGNEFCYTCILDCGECLEEKISFWQSIINFFLFIEEPVITGKAVTEITNISNFETTNISTPINTAACMEDWVCDNWGPYNSEGFRFRQCFDQNDCGTTIDFPETKEKCEWMEPEKKIEPIKPQINWTRVIITVFLIVFFIFLIVRGIKKGIKFISRLIKRFQPKKRKKSKKPDSFLTLRKNLNRLSKITIREDNKKYIVSKAAGIIKKTLLIHLKTRQKYTFLRLKHELQVSDLNLKIKKLAIGLIEDMEKHRFLEELTNTKLKSYIKKAKKLIPKPPQKPKRFSKNKKLKNKQLR